jgi:hypothetical protein
MVKKEEITRAKRIYDAILIVVKADPGKGNKWQFYYKGNKINATIEDEKYIEQLEKGYGFAKGSGLIVDFLIKQIYDNAIGTYINKEYTILQIKRQLPKEKTALQLEAPEH